jgi:hypothetical protein
MPEGDKKHGIDLRLQRVHSSVDILDVSHPSGDDWYISRFIVRAGILPKRHPTGRDTQRRHEQELEPDQQFEQAHSAHSLFAH